MRTAPRSRSKSPTSNQERRCFETGYEIEVSRARLRGHCGARLAARRNAAYARNSGAQFRSDVHDGHLPYRAKFQPFTGVGSGDHSRFSGRRRVPARMRTLPVGGTRAARVRGRRSRPAAPKSARLSANSVFTFADGARTAPRDARARAARTPWKAAVCTVLANDW